MNEKSLKTIFEKIDTDGNKSIDKEELKHFLNI